jgi:hypothetical protein
MWLFTPKIPKKKRSFIAVHSISSGLCKVKTARSGFSDGYINIALIKRSKSTGINHIVFLCDNLDSAQQRLRQVMPAAEFEIPDENVTAAEFKLKDPDGNALDVSERGWAV